MHLFSSFNLVCTYGSHSQESDGVDICNEPNLPIYILALLNLKLTDSILLINAI